MKSWNEIRKAATAFSKRWKNAYDEKAHAHLDALVDKAYGLSSSSTDADRVAHLFKLYAEKVKDIPKIRAAT